MKRLATLLLVVAVLASFVAACAAPTPEVVEKEVVVEKPVVETVVVEKEVVVKETVVVEPTPEPKGPKIVRVIQGEPNVGLDPVTASTALSTLVLHYMHDLLVERDENWKPIPWVAESWETNEDASEWTFHIRDGVKFSDGSPLTTEDVKFSFERMRASPIWEARLSSIEAMEVKDPNTIVFKMSRPLPEFLDLVASYRGYFIVSKAACQNDGCGDFTTPGTVVSGPWYLKKYVANSHMVLERNPHYWAYKEMGVPKFDQIITTFSSDQTGRVAAVEAGNADFADARPAHVERLLQNPNVKLYMGIRVDQFRGFGYDKSRPPFNDKRVRQAVGYALEPEDITQGCWLGYASSLWGGMFYDKDVEWAPLLARYPWKDKAREERLAIADQLLTEAGWEDRDGDGIRESYGIEGLADGTPLSANCSYERNWLQSACHVLLAQEWLKDIGFDLVPDGLDSANYWPDVKAGNFQMWFVGISGSPIPWEKIYMLYSSKGAWYTLVHGPHGFEEQAEVDAQIEEMYQETDLEKKKQLMSAVADKLADLQLATATGSQDRIVVTTAEMEGFYLLWDGSFRALLFADIPGR